MCTTIISHAIAVARRCRHLYDADIRYRQEVSASTEFYNACLLYVKYYDTTINIPEMGTDEYEEIIVELEELFAQ